MRLSSGEALVLKGDSGLNIECIKGLFVGSDISTGVSLKLLLRVTQKIEFL